MRSLRCRGPGFDLIEKGPELVTRHTQVRRWRAPMRLADVAGYLTRAAKSLLCVDFRFCRAIESPIVRRDGFIFL
jgi:hypothetical protein